MPDKRAVEKVRRLRLRHRGRGGQVSIYLGKLLRMFVYQNDWKVMPMAALIAAIVAMVVRSSFFVTMEGTLKGAFALSCVAIWNGCFNSIQVICRERAIIKREHRSGMHISAYIASHMIYQALLCLGQTILTMYVCRLMKVNFPKEGMFTQWMIVDVGITVYLMTYASDMLSLWISALVRSTTTAMTVMPFILIFQLVFSGGMFKMPAWADNMSMLTISNSGLKCVAAQADYNNMPMSSIWTALKRLDDPGDTIPVTVKLDDVLDALQDDRIAAISQLREEELGDALTVDSLLAQAEKLFPDSLVTVEIGDDGGEEIGFGDILEQLREYLKQNDMADVKLGSFDTWGDAIDSFLGLPFIQENRDKTFTVEISIHEIFELIGEEKLESYITEKSKGINYSSAYVRSKDNVLRYWGSLALFSFVYACLAVITLEFIDKDKR